MEKLIKELDWKIATEVDNTNSIKEIEMQKCIIIGDYLIRNNQDLIMSMTNYTLMCVRVNIEEHHLFNRHRTFEDLLKHTFDNYHYSWVMERILENEDNEIPQWFYIIEEISTELSICEWNLINYICSCISNMNYDLLEQEYECEEVFYGKRV